MALNLSPEKGVKLTKKDRAHVLKKMKQGWKATCLIPDYVFEAIIEERKKYNKNKNRRKRQFKDLDYICCSSYGRPRSKSYHFKEFKRILNENNLPNIRFHDLRKSYTTMLLGNNFDIKTISKLLGHSSEEITLNSYTNKYLLIENCWYY